MRKLIGTMALLALVAAWSLMAMAIAQSPYLQSSRALQFAYHVIAGVGWVLPALPLIAWMSRVRPPEALSTNNLTYRRLVSAQLRTGFIRQRHARPYLPP